MQASRSTAGCHIHVKLVDTSGSQAGDGAPRRFFVELWDVSGQPKYEQLRSVFYKQINGELAAQHCLSGLAIANKQAVAGEVMGQDLFRCQFHDQQSNRQYQQSNRNVHKSSAAAHTATSYTP
jgi:hypothetical protein